MTETRQHNVALLVLLMTGVLMGALDISIVAPALPAMQREFDLETRTLAWLFNVYVLGQLIGTPLLAKLSDRFGPRPVYITSIMLFAVGSIILVLSPSAAWLLIGRAIQGFGGGGIFPVAVKIIGDVFPPEKRGAALGFIGGVFGLAFLIGPILGGLLLDYGWQWLFLINVPIAVMLIIGATRLLPAGVRSGELKPFDRNGAITLSVGLAALAIAITNFDSANAIASLSSLNVWPFLLCFLVLAPLYWRFEKRAVDPIIKPEFFSSSQITVCTILSLTMGAMQSATAFYPALAVAALSITESRAAFLLIPGILVTTIASPAAGFLINKLGSRFLILFGLFFIAVGFLIYGNADLSIAVFITASCLAGLGFATAIGAPIRVIVLNAVKPQDRGAAQGLLNVSINVGQLLGAALVGGIAASMGGGAPGFQSSYLFMGAVAIVMLFLALRLHSKRTLEAQAKAAEAQAAG